MPHLLAGHLAAVGVTDALDTDPNQLSLPHDFAADRLELAHLMTRRCTYRLLHDRDRDVEHPLERLDADPLVGLMVALGPVGEVRARESLRLERIRVRRAPGDDVAGLIPARAQRLLGERHLRRLGTGAI